MVHTTRQNGFTLPELMVAIAIIAIIAAITFPMLTKMRDIFEDQTGINTIQVAITATRAYATRNIADMDPNIVPDAQYSGTAVLFTPGREIRLLENTQLALDVGGSFLEQSPNNRNGFHNIPDRDFLHLPRDVGVVGITRDPVLGKQYLPPPFAVRFDENGYLVVSDGTTPSKLVYYDANADGRFRIEDDTGQLMDGHSRLEPYFDSAGNYDVDKWDPDHWQYSPTDGFGNTPGIHPITHAEKLPFETIEAVIGIIVYSKRKFFEDGGDWPTTSPSGGSSVAGIYEWLDNNGTPIFFSRYTGALLKGGPD